MDDSGSRRPTFGGVPDDLADDITGNFDKLPDFIAASDGNGEIIGYISKEWLFGSTPPVSTLEEAAIYMKTRGFRETPVVDTDLRQIGIWYEGLGFISLDEASDPDFNPRQRLIDMGLLSPG